MASSTWSLDGKYRYRVASETPARSASSFICSASSPPVASMAVATCSIRACRSCCAGVEGRAGGAAPRRTESMSATWACRAGLTGALDGDLRRGPVQLRVHHLIRQLEQFARGLDLRPGLG